MKIIVSKKAKKKKKDKKFEENYWETIYPEDYVDILVKEEDLDNLKTASEKERE